MGGRAGYIWLREVCVSVCLCAWLATQVDPVEARLVALLLLSPQPPSLSRRVPNSPLVSGPIDTQSGMTGEASLKEFLSPKSS